MEFLYKTDRDDLRQLFGDRWVGPDSIPRGEDTLIAVYDDNPEGDGYGVEVYCIAYPARFFKIKAIGSNNSVGEFREGFCLSTGTGCEEWVAMTAKLINEGLVGIRTLTTPNGEQI